MKIRGLVVFVVFVFFAIALTQFCILQAPLVYAQEEDPGGEEEPEEEDIMAKPNPMEITTRGISKQSSLQKSASRSLETTATQSVSVEGVEGESLPIDPLGHEIISDDGEHGDSVSGVSAQGADTASWDPSESPVNWDPFDSQANLDSAEMNH